MAGFDKHYWDEHWRASADAGRGAPGEDPPNAQLVHETGGLQPGTALDAGCGSGSEALWLASRGWQVTAADISAEVLRRAADRARRAGLAGSVRWVEADLAVWDPAEVFDLVTTCYAHASIPQLELYERIASWVAPGGTLLVVGHLRHGAPDGAHDGAHDGHHQGHPGHPGHPGAPQRPDAATVILEAVLARLEEARWEVVTAEERAWVRARPGDVEVALRDVVVRARRRP